MKPLAPKKRRILVTGIRKGKKPWLIGLMSVHGTLWLDFSDDSSHPSGKRINHGISRLVALFPQLHLEEESFLTFDMGSLIGRYMQTELRNFRKGG